jgi:2,4-dienoyl-CoA reductase-like NADH-dependent reductase (Old Yellow Enzyme family)/thioredoxin reductase
MGFDLALSPIRIGPVEVKNRVVRAAHSGGLSYTDISEDVIAYHLARAKGGCGLTILEAASVHRSSLIHQSIATDAVIPGYRKLAELVRPHGMKLFQQLWHGGNMYQGADGVPWSVSTLIGAHGLVGSPMGKPEIAELRGAFKAAALRCRQGGLDGIEINAAHGYLFTQFFSPLHNDRTDEYGGSLQNRMRFLVEVLRDIREVLGDDLAIGVRMGPSEAPGGLPIDDVTAIAQTLEESSLIDFFDASVGDYYRPTTFAGAMDCPAGYEIEALTPLLSRLTVPRIVTGRFRALDEVEQVLRAGLADMVSMVRAQIADPYLVKKTQEGRINEVRPCIACNQGCVGGYARSSHMGCTVNATAGYEVALAEERIAPVHSPKKVLVVGGGPAGMEVARVASLMGHKVILAEASDELGGVINIAKKAPRLHALGDITAWLEQEVFRLGVDVRFGSYMEAAEIRAETPDVVFIATGSMPRMNGSQHANPGEKLSGVDLAHVTSSNDLIAGLGAHPKAGMRAVILDTVGHFEALAAALFLLERGVHVTIVTHQAAIGMFVEATMRNVPILEHMYSLGTFETLTRHQLVEVQPKHCLVRPLQASTNATRRIEADLVVLVTPNEPLRGLYDELRYEIPDIRLIGDARSPRDLQFAIRDGHLAARTLI